MIWIWSLNCDVTLTKFFAYQCTSELQTWNLSPNLSVSAHIHWLHCPIKNCCQWFRNQSVLTNHIQVSHLDSQQPEDSDSESKHRNSPCTNLNANEAESTLPVHRPDEPSSLEENQDITIPSTPLAASWFSPSFSLKINQPTFNLTTTQDHPYVVVHEKHHQPVNHLLLKVMSRYWRSFIQ